jgi:hypothetical protein
MSNSENKLVLGELMTFIIECIVLFFLIRWMTKKDKNKNIVIYVGEPEPKPKLKIIKGEKNE